VDCGALDAAQGETELERAIAEARGGTLFLRDVDDLAASMPARLATLLASHDVRVLAASDRGLEDAAGEGGAAGDLADRLGAVHIELPALTQRREDIPLLVQQCLDDVAEETAQSRRTCAPEAMELLAASRWPGNVRQLRSVVRQAATTGAGPLITPEQVQEALGQATQLPSFDAARDEFTRRYLVQLLQITEGNVSQAARLAQRNRTDFYKLLTKHDIRPESFKP
jgi:two-component system response regulator GlrR